MTSSLLTHRYLLNLVGKPIPVPSIKDGQTKDEIIRELHDSYMHAVQVSYNT